MTLRHDPTRPIALVLSGGGARGAFQVGAWEVLRTHPRGLQAPPDVISGTSAGALNGALIAAGLAPRDILSFWIDLADRPPIVANEKFFRSLGDVLRGMLLREPFRGLGLRAREGRILLDLLRGGRWYRQSGAIASALQWVLTARFDSVSYFLDHVRTSHLFDTSGLRDRLKRVIGPSLPRTGVRLAINAVDIRTGRVVRIVNHPPAKRADASARHYRYEPDITLDMIVASAAIPLLFNAVRVGDDMLWDGGLLVNSPMAPAVALGATRIIPVLVTANEAPADPLGTFGSAVERLVDTFLENAYNIDRKLLLDRNALARLTADKDLRVVELYRALRPPSGKLFNAGSYLYFERSVLRAMYDAGRAAARAWLERGPEIDGRERDA